MDISRLKGVIQRLSIFKDYSSLLVPVVIVLVGALIFIPTQLMSSKLSKEISKESVSIGKRIKSLSQDVVSSDQWMEEEKYQEAYERDANQIALLAKQSSQRQLLSYKIFPEPKDTSTLIFKEFGRKFREAVDGQIARVNARDCPTAAELQRSLQSSGTSRRPGRRGGSSSRLNERDTIIEDVLCREKAEAASVYANPADLSGYEFWGEHEYAGMGEAVKDCWYWQLAYWVIEDVIDTIAACNSGSDSVFTSPVKRLMAVSFTMSGRGSGSRGKAGDRPSYVLSIEDGLTGSLTARLSNDDIDVVHFNVIVVVSAKAVLPFMQQLCSAKQHSFRGFFGEAQEQIFKHNQIAILEYGVASINRGDIEHNLYRYGEDAVVRLDLICEYIFNKNGYDEIKPELVKNEHKP